MKAIQPGTRRDALLFTARLILAVSIFSLFAAFAPSLRADPPLPATANPTNPPPEITNSATPFADEGASAYKKLSLEQLMNLDVTSVSRAPEPFAQAPAAIEVITSDEIRRSGATSIPEALRLADNLEVAQINSHDWAISARGFNSGLGNKLLVMIDGRTVYSPLYSGVFWNVQDYLLEDLDRIEVVSGPGGTLWGANAVNGVINIITKSAKDTQGLYIESGGGVPGTTGGVADARSEPRDFTGIRYGGTLASNVYFRIYGKAFQRGNEDYPNGSPANDRWEMAQGGFRMDAEASSSDNFTLQGDIYGSDLRIPAGGLANQSGGNLLGRWSHVISENEDMSLQLYYDRTHLYDPISGFGTTQIVTDDLGTYDMDFQYRLQAGERNQVTWGLGYRFTHDVVSESTILQFLPPVLDRHLYSSFVQDEIKLTDHLFFTMGTKLEHNDYTGFEIEPSGRLQWNVTSNHMLWSAVSRAVRTPSRVDADIRENNPVPLITFLRGTPGFESEALIAYELGYRSQITPKFSTSLSTYYNDYTDLRSVEITPGGLLGVVPLHYANDMEGHTYGMELSMDYQVLE
ncbi:MAG TPA: TonB-dependent receptor, partial [Verrucomicrobiae bacterium]|nr:TonB-dependent receptor [Verrucomicrobiae bacterium]